jgi:arylsulfatase A-like enzyme
VWLGVWLAVPLVLAKAAHWGSPFSAVSGARVWLRDLLVSSHGDVAFATGLALAALVSLRLARGQARWTRTLSLLWLGLGAFCVGYAVVAVHIFDYLRSPLTYPLLYLAGDMRNMRSSIGSFISPAALAVLIGATVSYVPLVRICSRRLSPHPLAGGAALILAAAWTTWGSYTASGRWSDRADILIAKSPHWEFLASVGRELTGGSEMPALDASFPPDYLNDFRPPVATLRPAVAKVEAAPAGAAAARPRNVIVVVLESTSTRYLSAYGSPYHTTPTLEAAAAHALVFDSFYSHVGFTANALVSMSLSLHPYMTWREYTQEYPDLPGQTVAEALKPFGYRTGFLTAQLLDFVGMNRFLRNRGFDEIRDWKDIGTGEPYTSWGGDDRTLVDATLAWMDEDRHRPFYAMLWTQQTHHPYEIPPGETETDFFKGRPLPEDDYDLGRYLNNVAIVDRELARLFQGLVERGRDRDTVVIVTGDHGEAFGEPHPSWGHGFRVYDECVRVPLLIWSPTLYPQGRVVHTVGGHADLSPTIADLLGVPRLPSWEGRSLFDPDRPPRTYFYAANDHYLLGVREGTFKYVYNVTRGRDELYDLSKDPEEATNLAASQPERCRVLRQRLAAWKYHAGERLKGRWKPAGPSTDVRRVSLQ